MFGWELLLEVLQRRSYLMQGNIVLSPNCVQHVGLNQVHKREQRFVRVGKSNYRREAPLPLLSWIPATQNPRSHRRDWYSEVVRRLANAVRRQLARVLTAVQRETVCL